MQSGAVGFDDEQVALRDPRIDLAEAVPAGFGLNDNIFAADGNGQAAAGRAGEWNSLGSDACILEKLDEDSFEAVAFSAGRSTASHGSPRS
jgi:hypothetical protein